MEGVSSTSGNRNQKGKVVAGNGGAQHHAHLQTMAAIWRLLPDEAHALTAEGFLAPTANPIAVAFSEDLHPFAGFFELWEAKHFSVVSIFDDEDVRLLSAHGFRTHANSSILQSRTLGHLDGENNTSLRFGGSREVLCELPGDHGRGLVCNIWKKFIANQTHNTGGTQGIKPPPLVAVITNQCVNCGSTFAGRPTAQNHVVNSWTKGICRVDRSHMTRSLEEARSQSVATFALKSFVICK